VKLPYPVNDPRNYCSGCEKFQQGECDIFGEVTAKVVIKCKLSGYRVLRVVPWWSKRHYENKKGAE
jgi:hypothetical protein